MELIKADEGRFARLYAKELIVRYPTKKRHIWTLGARPAPGKLPPSQAHLGSVVGALISNNDPMVQKWGLKLLITLLKQQESAEFIGNFETLVPLLCEKAEEPITSGFGATELGRPKIEVAVGSLQALLEHLRLCFRLSYVSRHLDTITYAVLAILEAEAAIRGKSSVMTNTASFGTMSILNTPTSLSPADTPHSQSPNNSITAGSQQLSASDSQSQPPLLRQLSLSSQVGASSVPGSAAVLVYSELGRMTRDAAEGKKIVEFLLRFLDAKPTRWLEGPAMEIGLGMIRQACTQEHQRYLLASSLLHHAGCAVGLQAVHRSAVLEQAMMDAAALDVGMIAPMLLLTLQELPKSFTMSEPVSEEQQAYEKDVLEAVKMLAGRLTNKLLLTSVMGAALSRLSSPSPSSTASLRCCAAASEEYRHLSAANAGHRATGSTHLSDVLLRAVLGICLKWRMEQRVLAHEILINAVKGSTPGSYPRQLSLVLSAIWHESLLPDNGPVSYIAMDRTLEAVLQVEEKSEDVLQVCKMIVGLQAKVSSLGKLEGSGMDTTSGGPGGIISPAQQWAVLALCSSLWTRIAYKIKQPALVEAALMKAPANLPSIALLPKGGLESRPSVHPLGGSTILLQKGFTKEDNVVAQSGDTQGSLIGLQQAADGAGKAQQVLLSVPAFKKLLNAESSSAFSPLPVASIAPHITLGLAAGVAGLGGGDHKAKNLPLARGMSAMEEQLDTGLVAISPQAKRLKQLLLQGSRRVEDGVNGLAGEASGTSNKEEMEKISATPAPVIREGGSETLKDVLHGVQDALKL